MQKIKMLLLCGLLSLTIFSCDSDSDNGNVKSLIEKDGSVNVEFQTRFENGVTVLTTKQTIFVEGKPVKFTLKLDTIPNLKDTLTEFENEDSTWNANVKKQYKFFITLK